MATLEDHARKMDVSGMVVTVILTALAFAAGLFWNDAIRSFIEDVVPMQEKISAKFLAAIMVTLIIVIVAIIIIKLQKLGERHEKELKKKMRVLDSMVKRQSIQLERQRNEMKKKMLAKQVLINRLRKKRKGFTGFF
jgi:glucan phosphoethanolaminetransferase (alkaline phosphatase superfamily)